MNDLMRLYHDAACRARMLANERKIRALLQRWVSELEPSVVFRDGEVIGLCQADAPIGSEPFILLIDAGS